MSHHKLPFPSKATLLCLLQSVYGFTPASQIDQFYALVSKELKHHGPKATCQYLKALYTQAVMLALQLPVEPVPFRKSNKRGVLKVLGPFVPLLQSDNAKEKRAALTILRLCYLIFSDAEIATASIVTPTKRNGVQEILKSFRSFARSRIQYEDLSKCNFEVIPRARSGPNGPSSLLTGHLDASALFHRPQLLGALQRLADSMSGSRGVPQNRHKNPPASLTEWITLLHKWNIENISISPYDLKTSRLAFLSEGGCKTRTIAIGDLFSQMVLLPLHKSLMKRLRKMHQDCTFDQTKAISWLREKTKEGPVWSFDLTTATDRFPVKLQEIVLRWFAGKDISKAWLDTMVTFRDFSFKDTRKQVRTCRYEVGQGMGLYSSWPAFAYTHHMIVQWCAFKEGMKSFDEYRIIGDDVVISNERVAKRYRDTLEILEVPISSSKSIVSISPPYSGEIAKRLIWNGVDISPIPPELIKQVEKHVTMLPALIDEIQNRYGIDLPLLTSLPSLARIYSRRSDKEKAAILISAPSAFALGGGVSLYGHLSNELTSSLPESRPPQALGPWISVDPEVLPDISWIQSRIRTVFLLREYEKVFKEWSFTNPEVQDLVPEIPTGKACHTLTAISELHPYWFARSWINCELQELFSLRVLTLGQEDETNFEDVGLRFCLDPQLRGYREKSAAQAAIRSHLTLETYKVLTGRKPMPEVEHPRGGLLEAQVRLSAH